MTQPQPMNGERIIERATGALGAAAARLAADLGVAEELAEIRGGRVVELEKEVGQLRQSNEALQRRVNELEAAAAGDSSGESAGSES